MENTTTTTTTNNNNINNELNNSMMSREKLDQAASWVGSTVASAFFSSLERFSCVNVATTDPDDDDDTSLTQNDSLNLNHNHIQNDVNPPNDVTKLPVWFSILRYSIPACLCKILGFWFWFCFYETDNCAWIYFYIIVWKIEI